MFGELETERQSEKAGPFRERISTNGFTVQTAMWLKNHVHTHLAASAIASHEYGSLLPNKFHIITFIYLFLFIIGLKILARTVKQQKIKS